MSKNSLAHLAISGTVLSVRVTPKARGNNVEMVGDTIKVRVTVPASDGQANKAVTQLLAKSLGVAKSRLTLVRGQKSQNKLFELK